MQGEKLLEYGEPKYMKMKEQLRSLHFGVLSGGDLPSFRHQTGTRMEAVVLGIHEVPRDRFNVWFMFVSAATELDAS